MASDDWHRKNAKITRTMFGWEDHGILTFVLTLDYGGSGQGAGMICLSGGKPTTYMERGLELLADLMGAVGVERWEDLPGKSVVALFNRDEWSSPVRGIENFLGDKRVVWTDYADG
jgi:hypothetical protein